MVAALAALTAACGADGATAGRDVFEPVLPAGTPGAFVPIEAQPEYWPCGAEHPQPGRLVRFDPAAGAVVWEVDVPVQVEALAMSQGQLHLSDGVGLDIAVDHASGSLTFPARDIDTRTAYSAALPDGPGVDEQTARALASGDSFFEVSRVVDAVWIETDLVVLEIRPGADCA